MTSSIAPVDWTECLSLPAGSAPIGLFDSGIGGLSVFLHLAKHLPHEHYIYYADTLNVPYGSRSSQEISQWTLQAVTWLYHQGCKLIVIACNSASAHALELARQYYPGLPIVGLVPALKPAVLATRSKHVAVLATRATLEGQLLNQVIEEVARPTQTQVTKYFDAQLVPWVEAGMPRAHETAESLLAQLHEFAAQGVDHLVLGCTHYPFFRDFLETEIAKQKLDIKVVDSGAAIAARVKQLLQSDSKHQTKPLWLPKPQSLDTIKTLLPASTKSELTLTETAAVELPKLSFYATLYQPQLGDRVQNLVNQPVQLLNDTAP